MAQSKYIDLTGLSHYDEKIKAAIDAKDAVALKAAKDYADGLAGNYDAAGTAETKVKELADGQVKTNTDAIAKLNGGADAEGSVAKAVADAKTEVAAAAAAADAKAVAAQGTAADAKAAAAAVDKKIGEVPEGSTVMAQIQAVKDAAYDDTEVRGLIKTNADDIDALEGKVAANTSAITTLNGAGAGSVKKQIDDAFNDFATKVSDDGVVNTYKELVDYCATHSAEAAAMAGDIAKNATAISDLEKFVGELPEGTSASDVIAYINEKIAAEQVRAAGVESGLDARVKTLETAIGEGGSVADQISTAVSAEKDAREAADKTLDGKITVVKETADANAEAIKGLAAQADLDAVSGRVTTAEGKIKTLEGASHTHANADALDAITAGKVANWDDAYAKEHEHANKTVLDGITAAKVSAWDAAEQNAKAYADGLVAEFTPILNEEIDQLFNQA